MLTLALALTVQKVALPPVSPGLCLATANKLGGMLNSLGGALQDEAQAAREGRKTQYSSQRVDRMMESVEADAANVAKVKRRYGGAAASEADLAQLGKMRSPEWASYVKACAA